MALQSLLCKIINSAWNIEILGLPWAHAWALDASSSFTSSPLHRECTHFPLTLSDKHWSCGTRFHDRPRAPAQMLPLPAKPGNMLQLGILIYFADCRHPASLTRLSLSEVLRRFLSRARTQSLFAPFREDKSGYLL